MYAYVKEQEIQSLFLFLFNFSPIPLYSSICSFGIRKNSNLSLRLEEATNRFYNQVSNILKNYEDLFICMLSVHSQ